MEQKRRNLPAVNGSPRKKRRHNYSAPAKRRRRQRVSGIGAIGGVDLMGNLLYPAIGGSIARFADKVIPASWDGKMKAGAKIALGFVLPMIGKGQTKAVLGHIGGGMVAVGSADLITELGLISGIGAADDDELAVALEGIDDVDFEEVEEIDGVDDYDGVIHGDIDTINGDLDIINGDDEEDEDDVD